MVRLYVIMGFNQRILIPVILLVSSCILFVACAEIVLRITNTDDKENALFEYSPPKTQRQLRSYRKPAPAQVKEPHIFRILTLGDSLTWGDKVRSDSDVWPYVLEHKLKKTKADIEVINIAVMGFTTVNEFELLIRAGWAFDPDLIILQFCLNDPLPSGKNFTRVGEDWMYKTKNLVPVGRGHVFLSSHSYLYNFINDRYKALQRNNSGKDYNMLYKDDFSGWKNSKAALKAINASAEKKGVKAVFVMFPSFVSGIQTKDSYPYTHLHNKVTEVAKDSGFYVLDMLDKYIAEGKDFEYWRAIDGHPNEAAHELAAEAIKEIILKENLISNQKSL